jgi:hypothetical protein
MTMNRKRRSTGRGDKKNQIMTPDEAKIVSREKTLAAIDFISRTIVAASGANLILIVIHMLTTAITTVTIIATTGMNVLIGICGLWYLLKTVSRER